MLKAQRAAYILERLQQLYPQPPIPLDHRDPFTLLVAVLLSAQCTDERVNIVTKTLFQEYETAEDFANANPEVLEEQIRSTGFYRNKTKSIIGMAQELVATHNGKVPDNMGALVKLPGVGRKTANVVLGNAFGIDEGIVVDTHVKRISNLLGLTRQNDPVKIEQDLIALVPKSEWTLWPHLLIHHGRAVCQARKPKCEICILSDLCPSSSI